MTFFAISGSVWLLIGFLVGAVGVYLALMSFDVVTMSRAPTVPRPEKKPLDWQHIERILLVSKQGPDLLFLMQHEPIVAVAILEAARVSKKHSEILLELTEQNSTQEKFVLIEQAIHQAIDLYARIGPS